MRGRLPATSARTLGSVSMVALGVHERVAVAAALGVSGLDPRRRAAHRTTARRQRERLRTPEAPPLAGTPPGDAMGSHESIHKCRRTEPRRGSNWMARKSHSSTPSTLRLAHRTCVRLLRIMRACSLALGRLEQGNPGVTVSQAKPGQTVLTALLFSACNSGASSGGLDSTGGFMDRPARRVHHGRV